MGRVQDKIAIVTGAASGIGRACALRLAAEGASVVLTDLNEEDGAKTANECGPAAHFVRQDVSDEASWRALMKRTESDHGRLDVLVNNAGILISGTIESTSLEDFNRLHAVNAAGPFLGCKYAMPAMLRSGGGSIINISSIVALQGSPNHLAYGASKGSVRALTIGVATHCRDQKNRIRCNSVHPGGVNTPLLRAESKALGIDAEEFGKLARESGANLSEPGDIAAMVLFLASDEARAVNGAALVVDEGYIA